MDGYVYAMVILCFQFASEAHIALRSQGEELPTYTYGTIMACISGAFYFLVRETLQMISMISLGAFQAW